MHVGDHKTAKSHGAIDLKLDDDVSKALNQFLPYVRAKTDQHEALREEDAPCRHDEDDSGDD